MATTTPESLGYRMGWDDAARYAKGTRADRRQIRRRLAKAEVSFRPFWLGYWQAIERRTEDFAAAIKEGRIARTCNPHKLENLTRRQWAAAA